MYSGVLEERMDGVQSIPDVKVLNIDVFVRCCFTLAPE